ncbi:hypothetical protein OS493_020475, partial [Desmophyllum pertusum]
EQQDPQGIEDNEQPHGEEDHGGEIFELQVLGFPPPEQAEQREEEHQGQHGIENNEQFHKQGQEEEADQQPIAAGNLYSR